MAEGLLERLVTRLLRVPARPRPPAGSPGSLQIFNPAHGFYRYRLAGWILKQLGTVTGLVAGLVALRMVTVEIPYVGADLIHVIEIVGVVSFIAQLPVTFIMIGLDYRYRWYMVSDTSLRIREGLVRVREQTMTHANIQNLAIRQGPLQRLFGISDLRVRTAGGGHQSGGSEQEGSEAANMHLGYLRGVDNAADIRDLILARMRQLRDSGLGDPDEPAEPGEVPRAVASTGSSELLAAAGELLAEARRLRSTLEQRSDPGGAPGERLAGG
jgi:membrane protein YdbS with pleckstrin-like domain